MALQLSTENRCGRVPKFQLARAWEVKRSVRGFWALTLSAKCVHHVTVIQGTAARSKLLPSRTRENPAGFIRFSALASSPFPGAGGEQAAQCKLVHSHAAKNHGTKDVILTMAASVPMTRAARKVTGRGLRACEITRAQ